MSFHLFFKSIRLKIYNRLCKISPSTRPVVTAHEIRRADEIRNSQSCKNKEDSCTEYIYRIQSSVSMHEKFSPLTWKPSRAPGTPVNPRGGRRTGRRGCRPRVARYDCFAVILYWINGAGNNRARHNARMGRRPCRSGGTRTGFSVRRMRRGGGRRRRRRWSPPGVRRRTR